MEVDDDNNNNNNNSNAPQSSRKPHDRRTPRFSWNTQYEETFFRSLCESMQLGYKDNFAFKAGAWERAAIALRDKHQAFPEKSHLINKADNARKKFRMWRGLREDPEFLYNPVTRMVTASEEAWKRHFEKEPLSKALRGRPFDHEEYMEILFPDVVGSGGAPKRVMKKRKTDGTPGAPERSSTGQSIMDLTMDTNSYIQSPTQPSTQGPTQSSQLPTPSTSHPNPPPPGQPSTNALTPPDEHTPNATNAQKRPLAPDTSLSSYATKRRGRPTRFPPSIYGENATSSSIPTASLGFAPSRSLASAPAARPGIHSSFNTAALFEDGILSLAEVLKARAAPRWPEQAMEIFFRDFADEDPELQLKIAEKALTDENKALVFVKSTAELRKHWVGRLREVHLRNQPMGGAMGGGGGLGLGRSGDEAS